MPIILREQALRKRIEAMIDNYVPQNNEGWTKPITSSYRAGALSLLPLLLEMAAALEMVDCRSADIFSDKGKCLKCEALSSLDRFLSVD